MGIVDPRWKLSARDPGAPAWADVKDKAWHDERMAVYAAQIDRMDQQIGRLLAKLRELGKEEDTIVMFLSDNGGSAEEMEASWRSRFPEVTRDGRAMRVGNDPSVMPGPEEVMQSYGLPWGNASNTPFRRFKHWAHEGGVATPLIVSWPKMAANGTTTKQMGHIIDLLPTCLAAAGATYPAETRDGKRLASPEGASLVPILREEKRPEPAALFWEHEGNRAVRQGRWKLVAGDGEPWELYDMDTDRTETNNLARQEPERVRDLAEAYERWAARVGVEPWEKMRTRVPPPK
jgi:arylsulfatase